MWVIIATGPRADSISGRPAGCAPACGALQALAICGPGLCRQQGAQQHFEAPAELI
jgi:hypothetical protein